MGNREFGLKNEDFVGQRERTLENREHCGRYRGVPAATGGRRLEVWRKGLKCRKKTVLCRRSVVPLQAKRISAGGDVCGEREKERRAVGRAKEGGWC